MESRPRRTQREARFWRAFVRCRFLLAGALATLAGCVADQASRSIETTYPASQAAAKQATDPVPKTPQPPAPLTAGAWSNPNPATPAPAAPVTSQAAASPSAPRGNRDPNVKPSASDVANPPPSPLVMPLPAATYPIDLASALRLADVANPTIAAARTMILEALALQLTARTLLVPSLNSGVSYHGHDGLLQRSSGKMIDVSLQSLYVGAGANAVVAGTMGIPGVNIFSQLTDALFEPLAARQRVAGARFGAQATSLDILVDVAALHIQLLGNQSILDLQRLSESQFHEVYRITNDYAIAQEGREADAHRALSQWRRRQALVQKAEEDVAVVAAQLANLLNLDPAVRLEPIGGPLVPLNLISVDTPQQELIQLALRQRPDIAARTAAIGEAEAHYKQEIGRPLLPTLWLGFSGGVFGGGSNLTPPLVGNFAGRTDFDVRVYWTLLNLGAGNLALIKERNAEIGQAIAERARTINRTRDEVSSSLAEAKAAQNEIEIARAELTSAELSYKEDLDRTRFRGADRPRDVLPIELLNSLDLLAAARVNLVRALVRYDQSQFRLWVSLGSPPPLISD
jgi:outer membrane protein TolC